LRAYVLIQTEAHGASLAERLMTIPGVVTAEDVTGAYDAIALAGAGSTRHLLDEVIARILALPGVTRALPAPLIRSLAGRPTKESADREPDSGDRAA
jgi:DNA-binding Lrp family transcriptional regulator